MSSDVRRRSPRRRRARPREAIGDLLRCTAPDEVAVAVGVLVGEPRQGWVGLGRASGSVSYDFLTVYVTFFTADASCHSTWWQPQPEPVRRVEK